jgi:flagellar hook-length control protein FliK
MNNSANHSLTDSGKLSVSGNQTNIEKAEHSVNLNSQLASILSKNQLPALSIEASLAGNNTNRPSNSSTAGGQKTSTETTNRERVKDTATGNKKENSHKIESAAQTGPFTGKLNAEKIELSLDKNGTQKSDSGNVATQSVRGQIMSFGANDAVSVNRPITVDRGATAAANYSQTDLSGEALAKSDTVADIREQISLAVQGSIKQGQQQITIHLNPPELGRVSIKFTENNNELTGLLETTNSQTRAEIRQALPDIIRSLEESGINVKRLDVTLSDSSAKSDLMRQSAQQSFRDSPSQDLWQQFGNNNFHDTGGNQLSYNSFVTPANLSSSSESYSQSSPSPHQSSSSTNLLDVLI